MSYIPQTDPAGRKAMLQARQPRPDRIRCHVAGWPHLSNRPANGTLLAGIEHIIDLIEYLVARMNVW